MEAVPSSLEDCNFILNQLEKLGKILSFWKIQDICYIMGTEIFKIEGETTEKMMPQIANPLSKNGQNSLLSALNIH